jgi:hypothetical protein
VCDPQTDVENQIDDCRATDENRGAAIDAASPSAAFYSCLVGRPVNNGGRCHRRNRPRPRCSALAIHIHCLAAMAEGRGVTGAIAWKRHARVYFNPSKLM